MIRAMLVDDDECMRMLMRVTLDASGDFEIVAEAGDGQRAIEHAQQLQPDVMLLDMSMPVLDGMAALEQIRSVSPSTKVLMMSGFDSDDLADRAYELGAWGYIQKNMRPDQIIECMRKAARSTAGRMDQDQPPARLKMVTRDSRAAAQVPEAARS